MIRAIIAERERFAITVAIAISTIVFFGVIIIKIMQTLQEINTLFGI